MYGSIMRVRVKPDRREEYIRLMREMVPSADDYGNGLHSLEVAWEDKDPNRLVMLIHFRDKESYVANANRPETDQQYRQQLEYLEGEPEWIDVNWADYIGKPLGETATAGT